MANMKEALALIQNWPKMQRTGSTSEKDQEVSFIVRTAEAGINSGRPVVLRAHTTSEMHEWIGALWRREGGREGGWPGGRGREKRRWGTRRKHPRLPLAVHSSLAGCLFTW